MSQNTSIISWNLNGLSANMKKRQTLMELLDKELPDIICLQEIKCQGQALNSFVDILRTKYPHIYWNSATKKGYSGTMILSKIKPIKDYYGINISKHDTEGRVITLEFSNFILVTCYTPNSKSKLERLTYRTQEWEPDFRNYLKNQSKKKKVIVCGDLNVAHTEIDLANPKTNKKKAGFTQEEREQFSNLLNNNQLIDTFRNLNPDKTQAYTYWSNFANSRQRNVGWRIDYFLVEKDWMDQVVDSQILSNYLGSDHAPIKLIIKN